MEIEAEVMRYKKKAQKKPSPKAKHKHDYQPCIIRTDNIALHSNFGIVRVPKGKLKFGSYCTICGKSLYSGALDLKQAIEVAR